LYNIGTFQARFILFYRVRKKVVLLQAIKPERDYYIKRSQMVHIHIIKSNYSNYCHCVAVASADISSTNTIELKSSTINSEFIVINNKSKFNVIEKKFEIDSMKLVI